MKSYKITALAENTTYRHNCLAQHGQSILVEVDEYKMLFDVGEVNGAVEFNMKQLGVDINDISDIVISHRHIDHVGALLPMMPKLVNQRLFLPLQMGEPHIKSNSDKYNFLKPNPDGGYDIAISMKDALELNQYANVHLVDASGFEINKGIYTTGCIGDWMMEQALIIDQLSLGITVIVGCSHPTVEALIEKAKEVTGNSKVRAVIGGMHFTDYNDDQMRSHALALKELGVSLVVPSHCTTVAGGRVLTEVLGNDKVKISKTGTFGAGNSLVIGETIDFSFVG